MASLLGRFVRLSFSPAVRAPKNGMQRRFVSEQPNVSRLEIDANARGNLLLLIGCIALPLTIYMVSILCEELRCTYKMKVCVHLLLGLCSAFKSAGCTNAPINVHFCPTTCLQRKGGDLTFEIKFPSRGAWQSPLNVLLKSRLFLQEVQSQFFLAVKCPH